MTIEPQLFKNSLAQWTSGIAVVTMATEETRHGLTVSSFTSVSLEPPLVLICVAKKLYSHQVIEQSGAFAIHILHTGQLEWGKLFAGMYPDVEDRFADIDYTTAETGSPILPDVLAWLDCKLHSKADGGDHTIFMGEVVAAGTGNTNLPLLYHNRQWGQFTPLGQS